MYSREVERGYRTKEIRKFGFKQFSQLFRISWNKLEDNIAFDDSILDFVPDRQLQCLRVIPLLPVMLR